MATAAGLGQIEAWPQGSRVGVVVIGRNEGERLEAALGAVEGRGHPIVYVDSGSTDGSAEAARGHADVVIELGTERPFTAARGRNAGYAYLRERMPGLEFVQFVDGDTVLDPDWIEHAVRHLDADPTIASVSGHLEEGAGGSDRYARLLRMEWALPVGELDSCGGIATYRAEALDRVRGFNEELRAGEEPELCARLRRAGYRIVRIGARMGLHEGAIASFGEWWHRSVRSGEAAFECALRGGLRWAREDWHRIVSAFLWGALIPAFVLAGVVILLILGRPILGALLAGGTAALYTAQWLRIARSVRARAEVPADAALFATYCLLAKPAASWGGIRCLARRFTSASRGRVEVH